MRYGWLFIFLLLSCAIMARETWYVADNTTNFPNPERGFHAGYQLDVTREVMHSDMQDVWFIENAARGRSQLMRIYMLTGYREDSLTQQVLDLIDSDFAMYRKHGFKCLLRFSYTDQMKKVGGKYQDASPAIWKKHLEQLKPILHKNADVISLVQAGFLGVWGEWHSSSTQTAAGIPQQVKNDLMEQLLDAVPISRTIAIRTPSYKHAILGDTITLSSEEAFTGTPRARICHHNDAFLYEASNMGTYTNREEDMAFLAQECLYLPNGGESCVSKQSVYDKWANGTIAQQEMAELHYSYLAGDWETLLMAGWHAEGVYDKIAMHIGYRFQLVNSTIPATAVVGGQLPIQIAIRNVGYASPFNERKAYMVLRGKDTTYTFLLHTDPRRWLPNGVVTVLTDTISLPLGMPLGNYETCLWLPDVYESIHYDPRYAIRFANDWVWEDSTGYNNLRSTIEIDTIAKPEPPEPAPELRDDLDTVICLQAEELAQSISLIWKNPVRDTIINKIIVPIGNAKAVEVKDGEDYSTAQLTFLAPEMRVDYTATKRWLFSGFEVPVHWQNDASYVEFEYLGDGHNEPMIPYLGDEKDIHWIASSGATVSLNSTKWIYCYFMPSTVLWTNPPSYKFGERKITHIGFIADPGSPMSGSFSVRNVRLVREQTFPYTFAGVRILRKEGSAPTSYYDGQVVYMGRDEQFVDTSVLPNTTYYYAVYSIDQDFYFSYPQYCTAKTGPTSLSSLHPTPYTLHKIMQDGQLYIQINNQLFTILGQPK